MLVVEGRKLDWIVRELGRKRGFEWMNELPLNTRVPFMVAPVALARWIATTQHNLLEKEGITVCVAGGPYDLVDHGGLWAGVNGLLGKPIGWARFEIVAPADVEVIKIGLAPASSRKYVKHFVADEPRDLPVTQQEAWDVVFLPTAFPLALAALLGHNDQHMWPAIEHGAIILAGLRHEWESYLFEAAALGFGMESGTIANPFGASLNGDEETKECLQLCWAHGGHQPAVWQTVFDKVGLVEEIEEVVTDLCTNWNGGRKDHHEDFRSWGMRSLLKSSVNSSDTYISLPRGFVFRESDQLIYKEDQELRIGPALELRISPASIKWQDLDHSTWIGRVWWASKIWSAGLGNYIENTFGGEFEKQGGLSQAEIRHVLDLVASVSDMNEAKKRVFSDAFTGGAPYAPNLKERQLFDLLRRGEVDEALEMVKQDRQLANAMNEDRKPVLLVLGEMKNQSAMKAVISMGGDVHALDGGHRPIVAQLAGRSDQDIVSLLLDFGADINAYDPLGWSALQIALSSGKWDMCSMLIDRGASTTWGVEVGRTARDMVTGKHGQSQAADPVQQAYLDKLEKRGVIYNPSDAPQWLKKKVLEN